MTVSHETGSLTLNIDGAQQQAAGRHRCVRHGGTLCSRCLKNPPGKGDAYCAACRSAYNKDWRERNAREIARLRALDQQQEEEKRAEPNGQPDD